MIHMVEQEDTRLSIDEAAKLLGVSYKTIWRMVHSGKVAAQRVGGQYRIKKADLQGNIEPSGYRHKK